MNLQKESGEGLVDFWKTGIWETGKINFHLNEVNPVLKEYLDYMICGRTNLRILIPLSGKSKDIKFLVDQGHSVTCIEGVRQPILEFFQDFNIEFDVYPLNDINGFLYEAFDGKLKIYNCDFFSVSRDLIGAVDGVWDRAAYVALDEKYRKRYSSHLLTLLAPGSKYLLVTVEFELSDFSGPPYCISDEEIEENFGSTCSIQRLMKEPSKTAYLLQVEPPNVMFEKLYILTFNG